MKRIYPEDGGWFSENQIVIPSWDDTFRGLIFRRYRDMKARVNGCPHKRAKSKGLPIVGRDEFVEWSLDHDGYAWYYKEWVDSNYDTMLAPSIHRVDFTKGYIFGNMEWVSVEEHYLITLAERRQDKWTQG